MAFNLIALRNRHLRQHRLCATKTGLASPTNVDGNAIKNRNEIVTLSASAPARVRHLVRTSALILPDLTYHGVDGDVSARRPNMAYDASRGGAARCFKSGQRQYRYQ